MKFFKSGTVSHYM